VKTVFLFITKSVITKQMKKYLLFILLISAYGIVSAQNKAIMLNVAKKSQYVGKSKKNAWYTGANGLKVRTWFTGHHIEVTAFSKAKNASLLVLNPPEPQLIEVTEYDLNEDGRKEIIVAYTPEFAILNFRVFDGTTLKQLGAGTGSEYLKFIDGKLAIVFEHSTNEELNFYVLKNGRLTEAGTKNIKRR
jgi:hypothetical protein